MVTYNWRLPGAPASTPEASANVVQMSDNVEELKKKAKMIDSNRLNSLVCSKLFSRSTGHSFVLFCPERFKKKNKIKIKNKIQKGQALIFVCVAFAYVVRGG